MLWANLILCDFNKTEQLQLLIKTVITLGNTFPQRLIGGTIEWPVADLSPLDYFIGCFIKTKGLSD